MVLVRCDRVVLRPVHSSGQTGRRGKAVRARVQLGDQDFCHPGGAGGLIFSNSYSSETHSGKCTL